MVALRWVAILLVAVLGGYFGHQLTGSWLAVPVSAIALGFAVDKMFADEWLIALATLSITVVVLFQFIESASTPERAGPFGDQPLTAKDGSGEKNGASLMKQIGKTVGEQAERVQSAVGLGSGPTEKKPASSVFRDCPSCPEMVAVAAGEFLMGSSPAQSGAADGRENPQHKVKISSFSAGRFAVTRGQFAEFIKATNYTTDAQRNAGCFVLQAKGWAIEPQGSWRNPGFKQADDHPAVCISWNDTQAYVAWLSTLTQKKYRLLTEAEREYATRAASTGAYWWGDSITPEQANYRTADAGTDKTAWRKATVAVNQFAANPMGFYNVHGNVGEWVQDCEHDNYRSAPADGSAWTQNCVSTKRMMRGGGWVSDAEGLRSASRAGFSADLASHAGGFRVARD